MNGILTIMADKTPTTAGLGTYGIIIYFVIIVAALYFIMIRPQRKKQKQEEKMRNDIKVGDEILTIGGIYGKIIALKEDSFIIESGPDRTKIKIAKWAMQQNFTVRESEPQEVTKTKKKKTDQPAG